MIFQHFSNSLIKTSSIREEYEKDQRDRSYSSFVGSVKDKPVKAFGKGFAAGVALPTILSVANSGMLDPDMHAKKNKIQERIYHGSMAFEAAGMAKKDAKTLASSLDRAMVTHGIRGPAGESLDKNFKVGLKSLISQQVAGSIPVTESIKGMQGEFGVKTPIGRTVKSMASVEQVRGAIQGLDNKAKAKVSTDFAEDVIKRNFPEIARGKLSIMSDSEYKDILDIGKGIAKLKGKSFSGKSTTMKRLGRFAKGNALTPLIIGLAGGAAAVTSLQQKKDYYKKLRRRSDAKR